MFDFEWVNQPEAWVALATLTVLEIVLGIDNIIFISIFSAKLPLHQQPKARRLGLALALITRVLLLLGLAWLAHLQKPFYTLNILGQKIDLSGKSLILILGGLFLLWKSVREIHKKLEGEPDHTKTAAAPSFASVLVHIMIFDVVFSLDSVITAVGMAQQVMVMVIAIVLAMVVMLLFVNTISNFVDRHPTIKMLALSFLILIGVLLVAEGLGQHVPKGYVYFAMAFSVVVEILNMRARHLPAPPRPPHPTTPASGSR